MKAPCLLHATRRFEAARELPRRPLHGHGFVVTAVAALAAAHPASVAAEAVAALGERLQTVIAPLDYARLNDTVDVPSDERLAHWIAQRLDLPDLPVLRRVAVRSTLRQGAEWRSGGATQAWRRYRFEAAHRLPRVPAGHKCGRMHGHGFEAVLHARLAPDDAALAFNGDLAGTLYERLDAAWAPMHFALNYRCLNEIDGLDNPTSERLSSWLWTQLRPALPALCGVTVFETASCGAQFDGAQYRIWKDFTLDSATQLHHAAPGSAAARLHGHTYTLRLHLTAPLDEALGWTLDFGDVKAAFDPLFKSLDHQPLHELAAQAGLHDADTAALARWILDRCRRELPALVRVDLFETEGCGASVEPIADWDGADVAPACDIPV